MKKLVAVLFVLASGCIPDREIVRAAFDGCDGHLDEFHGKWVECMRLGAEATTCAVYAQELVCRGEPPEACEHSLDGALANLKAMRVKLDDARARYVRNHHQLMALRSCYNWEGFFDNCQGFASASEILCEGFDGPQDVCTQENWASYQATCKHGMVEVP